MKVELTSGQGRTDSLGLGFDVSRPQVTGQQREAYVRSGTYMVHSCRSSSPLWLSGGRMDSEHQPCMA